MRTPYPPFTRADILLYTLYIHHSPFSPYTSLSPCLSLKVTCAGTLDALLSMATVSSLPGYTWATVLSPHESQCEVPVLDITDGRHPMIESAFNQR